MPSLIILPDIKGLRIILTYKCNKRCSYCYQKKFTKHIIDYNKLEILLVILQDVSFKYITVQGGEVFNIDNYIDYLEVIYNYFPGIKKIITAKSLKNVNINEIKSLNYQIATSENTTGDIINIYYDGESKSFFNRLDKYILTGKPITICSKMNKRLNPPVIKGIKPKKITDWLYEYKKLNIKYFSETNNYDNNELIITPYGRMTMDFNDVKKGL